MSDWNQSHSDNQNNHETSNHDGLIAAAERGESQPEEIDFINRGNPADDHADFTQPNETPEQSASTSQEDEAALLAEMEAEENGETADEPNSESDEYEADIPNESSPRGGDFRWTDLRKAVEFTRIFMEMPRIRRDQFRYLLGISNEASVVDILQALTPPAGKIASISFITDYIEKINSGTLGFMDGIRISSELSDLPDDSKRNIFATLNALGAMLSIDDESTAVLRYRKNMNVNDVFLLLNTGVEQVDGEGALKLLSGAQELLSVWVD